MANEGNIPNQQNSPVTWEEMNEMKTKLDEMFKLVQLRATKGSHAHPPVSTSLPKEVVVAPTKVILWTNGSGKSKEVPQSGTN